MRESGRFIPAMLLIGVFAVGAASCSSDETVQGDGERADERPAIELEAVASGLVTPWAIAFAPDGRIFVTERAGRVRVVDEGGLRPEPWAELDVVSPEYRSEGGLLGIAVAPDFETSRHVYVVGTFLSDGQLANRVLRLTDRDGRGVSQTVVIDGLPAVDAEPGSERAIHTHVGGALGFGPDGMLYTTTGDATQPDLAQDPRSLAGKLLRYQADGSVPADNPTPGSPVYALGLRNPQGLAWHAGTGDPFVTEHGPSELSWESAGGWFGDEVNAIRPGRNYGWPDVVGAAGEGASVDPLVEWSPSVGPAGIAVYSGSRFPWRGELLVANLRGQRLWRIVVEQDASRAAGWRAVSQEPVLEGAVGRIRAVAVGPDGDLYITSSNRDGRGKPREGDDHLYRVVPAGVRGEGEQSLSDEPG